MQLLKPESITHYQLSLNMEEKKNDQIVCIEQIKLSLLAKSCLCPGLVALITNLIKSSINTTRDIESKKSKKNWQWLHDYWLGKRYEIYRVGIPASYADQSFYYIANEVFKEKGYVLFALEIALNDKPSGDILINPGDFKLPRPQSQSIRYTYYGYIIAPDIVEAEKFFQEKNLSNQMHVKSNLAEMGPD
jgi:hypothetical protein